jgi:hypothetical protein
MQPTRDGLKSARTPWVCEFPSLPPCVRVCMCMLILESIISHQDTADIPVLMLANKQDLPNSLKVEEIQQAGFTRIAEALSARDSKVLPISALTGYISPLLCSSNIK